MVTLIFFVLYISSLVNGLEWLGFKHPINYTWKEEDCDQETFTGNIKTMEELLFCRKHRDSMSLIIKSNYLTKLSCKGMLFKKRWNCSRIDEINDGQIPYELKENTAESAFVHALSGAATTYRYTEMCYKNKDCSCGPKGFHVTETELKESIKFHPCTNFLKKGMQFAKKFVESVYKTKKEKEGKNLKKEYKIKLYNQKVGRKIVLLNQEITCECFGPSTSCSAKVCYKKIPLFRNIANEILKKYQEALAKNEPRQEILKTISSNVTTSVHQRTNQLILAKSYKSKRLRFTKQSPNYCDKNDLFGLSGTQGRLCAVNATDTESCKTLCCGRGFSVKRYTVTVNCHCRYFHCCRVECKQCEALQTEYICK